MSFLENYLKIRPFAYHVTNRANLGSLARRRRLQPSAELIRRAGRSDLVHRRREVPTPVEIDGEFVLLQDQLPLLMANADLVNGWDTGDLVAFLNEHVFFWPGTRQGPIRSGERLWEHYEHEGPAVLRFDARGLLSANPAAVPLFCPFNSGAPRMQNGRRVPRGPGLFTPASSFPRSPGKVVELVFRGEVALPTNTEVAGADGKWYPLSTAAV